MKSRYTTRDLVLLALAALLAATVLLVSARGHMTSTDSYDVQLAAAQRMQRCMDAVLDYRQQRGIPLSEFDLHGTGLVGEEFNGLTTTLGELQAKRTTANGDMAALAVLLLQEVGLSAGDQVGASLSSSFPGMNLAVLSACAELEIEVVAVVSVGSSTWGGNTPGLSFPETLALLIRDGLLPDCIAAVTLGGDHDTGGGMDQEMVAAVEQRLAALGYEIWREPDFQSNLSRRMALFEEDGPIACYIGVGGNLISSGGGDHMFPYGVVLPSSRPVTLRERSGLLEHYHAQGVPVIHILNIKQLVEEYGLPLDPPVLPEPGTSAVYHRLTYPKLPAALGLMAALSGLLLYRRMGRKKP